jgi:membrane protein implicated in regulation of membrane protease activity
MTGLYLFAAGAGVPLVAWFLLSGGDEGSDDGGGGDEGIGGLMLRLLPLSTLALAAATFGICGLVVGAVGTSAGTTFVAAALTAVAAGALNTMTFGYLRRSQSTTSGADAQLAGAVGRVVLPVAATQRGRIAVAVGGQQIYLSAQALPGAADEDALEVGAPVLVIDFQDGVASVTRLDAELT